MYGIDKKEAERILREIEEAEKKYKEEQEKDKN
jgi:nitrogen fixation-related uncharacterized protein